MYLVVAHHFYSSLSIGTAQTLDDLYLEDMVTDFNQRKRLRYF